MELLLQLHFQTISLILQKYHNFSLLRKNFTRHRLKNIREKALIYKHYIFCMVIFSCAFKKETGDGFLEKPKIKHTLDNQNTF
jgi:hypothetical protein